MNEWQNTPWWQVPGARRWKRCWNLAPDVYTLLRESRSVETARKRIMAFLENIAIEFRSEDLDITSWDFILLRDATLALKSLIASKNERLSGDSALKYLWEAAREGDAPVDQGFIDEFEHLFRALKGQAKVYPSYLTEGLVAHQYDHFKGREKAQKRSEFLDHLGEKMGNLTERYPSGLDPEVAQLRRETRERILHHLQAEPGDWEDYRWHYAHVIRSIEGLDWMKKVIHLREEEEAAIRLALESRIPMGLTPHTLHLLCPEPDGRDEAVRRQVFPSMAYVRSMIKHRKDRRRSLDFMQEGDTSPVDHITRRYPRVAIFKPYDTCPQICVYCQRNWEISEPFSPGAQQAGKDWDRALRWVEQHPQIMDLLVTGGDPLSMGDDLLEQILERLSRIPHLKSVRIATRVLVTCPQRITPNLLDLLDRYNRPGRQILYVVTHFQHPWEIGPENLEAVTALRRRGLGVYNQQVFTFISSKRFAAVALRILLRQIGVDPYYTFNMKGKEEMAEMSVPLARLLQERKEEARLLPGIYRTDEPVFNVPFLGKNHLRARHDRQLVGILPDGRRVYAFHPWEKNLRGVEPYIYRDPSIRGYLDRLEMDGEDPEEYRSIWYYY